jgi:hypothetical protein
MPTRAVQSPAGAAPRTLRERPVEGGQEEGAVANACAGGSNPAGINPDAKLNERKCRRSRTMKYPTSLSAKSCPRHFSR